MDPVRRSMMTAGLGAGLSTLTVSGAVAGRSTTPSPSTQSYNAWAALVPSTPSATSQHLQRLIDRHASNRQPLFLPPGQFLVSGIELRPGSVLIGANGLTEFLFAGGSAFFSATQAENVTLQGLTFNGQSVPFADTSTDALLAFQNCRRLRIDHCTLRASADNAISLDTCSGTVCNTLIEDARHTGLFAVNSASLDVAHNDIHRCGDNGVQIWRSATGTDASSVRHNRITHIAANSGGSGQHGNGVNVFRSGDVSVTNNHISDCAYSAVRGNSASNLQILANTCRHIGEVALYAEFSFEGAMISNNLVHDAASGVSVTNFNEGGRLATITANLIRDLKRREFEPVDKRGIGISVEADAVVSNNVIENAPSSGIALGWGQYCRDLIATDNMIRNAKVGILVSEDASAGPILISGNVISGSTDGAIRQARLDHPIGPDLSAQNATLPGLTLANNVTPARSG